MNQKIELPSEHSRGERYIVVDGVLPANELKTTGREFDSIALKPRLSAIDPVYDGFSFRGSDCRISLSNQDPALSPVKRAIIGQIEDSFELFEHETGEKYEVTITAWGYPAGSRLSWHNDGGQGRVGAYVYFVHDEWKYGWGGGLAIVDRGTSGVDPDDPYALLETGPSPILIRPRSNRLVLFKSYTYHSILRVDCTAGDRLRKTYSGFIRRIDMAD